jgi:hypothetical protein
MSTTAKEAQMVHGGMAAAMRVVRPREVQRRGEPVRVYRRRTERWATYLGYMGILGAASAVLVASVAGDLRRVDAHVVPLMAILLLFLSIPTAVAYWIPRFGVEVSGSGVRNVAPTSVTFTGWDEIKRFVITRGALAGACVAAEHWDGSMTPLGALASWLGGLEPYCDALNRELQSARVPPEGIIPSVFNREVVEAVASSVADEARESGTAGAGNEVGFASTEEFGVIGR